jgi:FkbH-like protein
VLFPVCVGWGPKSAAVAEILSIWNIGEDSVVVIDDNPMELSEVQRAFPSITCLEFRGNDPASVWSLLNRLRDLFGKPFITQEDNLRRTSLRAAARVRETEHHPDSPEFLRSLKGIVTLDYRKRDSDQRALELINKTNQFNLNGYRMSEREWRDWLESSESIVVIVSYQDRFGPLGRIATLVGTRLGSCVTITHWVMSCRAFSRQLEYHTLDSLFRQSNAEEVEFAFQPTERNQPLQEFLRHIGVHQNGSGSSRLSRSQFLSRPEALPHQASELLE